MVNGFGKSVDFSVFARQCEFGLQGWNDFVEDFSGSQVDYALSDSNSACKAAKLRPS